MRIELEPSLERWVEAQILDRAQADRIRQFEAEQAPERRARWPVIMALAFGGIMLARRRSAVRQCALGRVIALPAHGAPGAGGGRISSGRRIFAGADSARWASRCMRWAPWRWAARSPWRGRSSICRSTGLPRSCCGPRARLPDGCCSAIGRIWRCRRSCCPGGWPANGRRRLHAGRLLAGDLLRHPAARHLLSQRPHAGRRQPRRSRACGADLDRRAGAAAGHAGGGIRAPCLRPRERHGSGAAGGRLGLRDPAAARVRLRLPPERGVDELQWRRSGWSA